jgi:putative transposase
LGAIVRSFKSSVTRHINEYRGTPGSKVWLRNYYEHIIRSESELDRIRAYIAENPARWAYDRENPNAIPAETKEKWAV